MDKNKTNSSGFTVVEGLVLVILIAIIGFGGWYVYTNHRSHTTSTTAPTTHKPVVVAPVFTNIWTGKGKTGDWSDATNWSLGKPVNGQDLKINTALVPPTMNSDGSPNKAFNDDIAGLVVHSLIFTGSRNSVNNVLNVSGDTLTVTNQILDDDTNNKIAAGPQISNNIILEGNVSIDSPNQSSLIFEGDVGIPKTSSVQMQTARITPADFSTPISQLPAFLIEFYGALSGAGSIHVTSNSSVGFEGTSPDMNGTVTIASGAVAELSNAIPDVEDGSTLNTPDDLGISSITIQNGGNLEINSGGSLEGANQTSAMNIVNNISMSGNGSAYVAQNPTGNVTGAITNCLGGQDGCSGGPSGQTTPGIITFTGAVTLNGNTELGAITETLDGNPALYSNTNYIFKKPIVNPDSYTLSAVPNSKVEISR